MAEALLNGPPIRLDEAELRRYAKVASRLFAGRPRLAQGNRPHPLRAGQGMEFLDHRAYQPGDSLRDIDWLATARSGRTQVRRFRHEVSSDWHLCVDVSASMGQTDGRKWRLTGQLAAALSYLLLHLDNRVRLILFKQTASGLTPLGRGQTSYTNILRLLERSAPQDRGGDSDLGVCLPWVPRGSQVIVLSDFLKADGMRDDLARMALRTEECHAIQVFDPKEFELAERGDLRLIDIESGEAQSTTLNGGSAQRVTQLAEMQRHELSRHCRSFGIRHTAANTASGWQQVLMDDIIRPGLRHA